MRCANETREKSSIEGAALDCLDVSGLALPGFARYDQLHHFRVASTKPIFPRETPDGQTIQWASAGWRQLDPATILIQILPTLCIYEEAGVYLIDIWCVMSNQ